MYTYTVYYKKLNVAGNLIYDSIYYTTYSTQI